MRAPRRSDELELTTARAGCANKSNLFVREVARGMTTSHEARWPRNDSSPYNLWGRGRSPPPRSRVGACSRLSHPRERSAINFFSAATRRGRDEMRDTEMRDTDRLIEVKEPPASLTRSFTAALSPRGPAPSSFVTYDAELWLPTMRAAVSGISRFVLYPWILLTSLTFFLALVSELYAAPPWWVSLPPFAHTVLGGALSFLMVFRTNTAYSRWWEARLMWGQITIASRNIGAQSAAMMHPRPRLELLSVLSVFPIALKNALRDEPTLAAELATAEAMGSQPIEGGESALPASHSLHDLCEAPSAPMVILETLSRVARAGLRSDDGLAASSYLHLCEEVRSLAAAATACERIKTSPMPLGYVSALRAFLVLWLFSLPLTMISSYGHSAVPAVSCIGFLFLNLENVALEIEQPFGHDANDLPLENYCAGIERVLLNLIRSARERAGAAGAPKS